MIEGMNGPLSRFSIDELLDEILTRGDALVFLFLRDKGGHQVCDTRFDGGYYTCMGMAGQFIRSMEQDQDFRDAHGPGEGTEL